MSNAGKSAEDRFVEAMLDLWDNTYMRDTENAEPSFRAAVEAFADAVCECIHDACFDCAGYDDKHLREMGCDHSLCRDLLLKRVMEGEGRER
jgi:hypothetical protein